MTAKILFELIQNMSKEEKRFFKILNDSQNKNKKYVLLFDFIDKSNKYTDDVMVRFAEKYNLSNSVVSSRNYLGEMILHSLTIFQSKKI